MPISQICLSHPSLARGRGASLATRQTRGLPRGEKSACGFDRADYDDGTVGARAVRGGAWPWTRRHVGEMQGGAWRDIVTSAFSAEEQRATASRGSRSPGAWKRDSDQRCDA